MKTLFSLIEINLALALLSVLGVVVIQDPKLELTAETLTPIPSSQNSFDARSPASPSTAPQIEAPIPQSQVSQPETFSDPDRDGQKTASTDTNQSAIIVQDRVTIERYAQKIKSLESQLAQSQQAQPAEPTPTQAAKPVAPKSVPNQSSALRARQAATQLQPPSIKTQRKPTVVNTTQVKPPASRITAPVVAASSNSSKSVDRPVQSKVLKTSTPRIVTIKPTSSPPKRVTASPSLSPAPTTTNRPQITPNASSTPSLAKTSPRVVTTQNNQPSPSTSAAVKPQPTNLFATPKVQTTRKTSTDNNTQIVTTPKRVFVGDKKNAKIQSSASLPTTDLPASACACSEIVVPDSPASEPVATVPPTTTVAIAKVTSQPASPSEQYLDSSNRSIYEANNLAYGLVIANSKKQITYGTQMYRKVQTAIRLLRRGDSLEVAAQKASVPMSVIAQLQAWGETRPGSIVAER